MGEGAARNGAPQGRRDASSVLTKSAAYNALAQAARSLVPFVVNLCVARKLTPEQYRLPAVHFHLITMSVLLLSREGVRRACMRHASVDDGNAAVNAAGEEKDADCPAATTTQKLRTGRREGRGTANSEEGQAADEDGNHHGVQDARNWRARSSDMRIIVNTSWISVPLSCLIACVVCAGFAVLHPRPAAETYDDAKLGGWGTARGLFPVVDEYTVAVFLQGLAAVIEVLSEPLQAIARFRLQFHVFAFSETAAAFAGAMTTAILLVTTDASPTIFGYSRVATACVSITVLFAHYLALSGEDIDGDIDSRSSPARVWDRILALLPRRIEGHPATDARRGPGGSKAAVGSAAGEKRERDYLFDARLLKLTFDYSVQAAEKLILGEGEKIVLAWMATGYNQGVFGLVSNLGSLAVRLLFFPLEQAAFLAFGMSGGASSSGSGSGPTSVTYEIMRAKRLDAYQVLVRSLRLAVVIGLVFLCFGPPYSYTLVRMLYGRAWASTEAPAVLAIYCYYVSLLAINGISEAFVHATASSSQLYYSNAWMLIVSCVSMCASVALIGRAGAAGLVLSNCINMALRIGYSLRYIRGYRRELLGDDGTPLAAALPSVRAIFVLAAVRVLTGLTSTLVPSSEGTSFVLNAAAHVSVGAIGLCVFLLYLLFADGSPLDAPLRAKIASLVRVRDSSVADGKKER